MSSSREKAASSRVLNFLCEWDRGNKCTRMRILQKFLQENTGKTSPELELQFAQAGSLFLTRITAWIRLTYMFNMCLHLQLKALGVFLSAASNQQYLMEFLEVGGVMTLLEIINQKQSGNEEKAEALRLLCIISNAGRKYKEIICESYGVKAIVQCLVKSDSEETQHTASCLLESLANGNPLYQTQAIVKTAHPAIVEPLLNVLCSYHLGVQYEAIELIKYLQHTDVRDTLLPALINLLKPKNQVVHKHKILQDLATAQKDDMFPLFIQQAAAAKALRMLAMERRETSEELIRLGAVHHLLFAMGNQEHADAQRQASLTLECAPIQWLRNMCAEPWDPLCSTFYGTEAKHNAELLYMNMDEVQVDILLNNKVNLSREFEEQNTEQKS